jgi:hypothetical protein
MTLVSVTGSGRESPDERVADFHRIQRFELMLAGCFEGFIEGGNMPTNP